MICLSKALIEDSNQHKDQHLLKHSVWSDSGVLVVRNRLPYGDYCLAPPVVVDTKQDVCELAANLKSDHVRFRNAAIKARDCGSHLVILVENEDGIKNLDDLAGWVEPADHFRIRASLNGNAVRWMGTCVKQNRMGQPYDLGLAHICRQMSKKYGLEFDFCTPEESGTRVLEHLGVIV